MSYKLDFRGLVKELGGPMACYRRLKQMGVEVKPRTLNKWVTRGDIGVIYLVNLLAHEALVGVPMDLNQFIVREDDPEGPRLVRRPRRRPAGEPAASQ